MYLFIFFSLSVKGMYVRITICNDDGITHYLELFQKFIYIK